MLTNQIWFLLSNIFTLLFVSDSIETEFWLHELRKSEVPVPLSIQHRRLGRYYMRGFPEGVWGTNLFPSISLEPMNDISDYVAHVLHRVYEPSETIEFSYGKFKQRMEEHFCQIQNSSSWACCTERQADCNKPHRGAIEVMHALRDPVQGMPVVFLYRWCTAAWAYYKKLEDENTKKNVITKITAICPNPCIGNPCRTVTYGGNQDICNVVGPFEDDYACECPTNTEWDQRSHSCVSINPCLLDGNKLCHPENTVRCIAKTDSDVMCLCKSEFMGSDCSLQRNACVERINKTQPTGNENCRVQFGNNCYGIPGTDYYNCTCRFGYELSLSISEDNCYGRRDPCQTHYVLDYMNQNFLQYDQVDELNTSATDLENARARSARYINHRGLVCLNGGHCVPSPDLSRAMCLCPTASDGSPLYLGPNCEIPVGTWSTWSSLSPCIPKDCGHTRYRWRRRRCLNTTSAEHLLNVGSWKREDAANTKSVYSPPIRCAGTTEEVIPCDPMDPCMILRLPGYLREEILDYNSLYYFGCITLGYFVFSISVWYVFATPILKALQKRRHKLDVTRVTAPAMETN